MPSKYPESTQKIFAPNGFSSVKRWVEGSVQGAVKKWVEKVVRKYPDNLTITEINILEILKTDKTLTRQIIAKKLDISPDTVKKNIAKLKQKGFLKRIGPAKGGYWEIVE